MTAGENLTEQMDHDAFAKFVGEFKEETDRAAVILAAAKLDVLLYQLFRKVLVPIPVPQDELLDQDRPLSSFGAKINLCHRLGLIDAEFAQALHMIRKIRNEFAHELANSKLSEGPHRDRVRTLVMPFGRVRNFFDELIRGFFKGLPSGPSTEFRMVVCIMAVRLEALLIRATLVKSSIETVQLIDSEWISSPTQSQSALEKKEK